MFNSYLGVLEPRARKMPLFPIVFGGGLILTWKEPDLTQADFQKCSTSFYLLSNLYREGKKGKMQHVLAFLGANLHFFATK